MVAADRKVTSICCDPERAPITYHWYRIDSDLRLVPRLRELLSAEPISSSDIDRFVGEFRDRMLLLTEGKLRPVHHIQDLDRPTNIRLYEVRFRFEFGNDGEIRVRAYHSEQKDMYSTVIGLHMHVKNTLPGVDVRALQDLEIDKAAARYWQGRPSNWGL